MNLPVPAGFVLHNHCAIIILTSDEQPGSISRAWHLDVRQLVTRCISFRIYAVGSPDRCHGAPVDRQFAFGLTARQSADINFRGGCGQQPTSRANDGLPVCNDATGGMAPLGDGGGTPLSRDGRNGSGGGGGYISGATTVGGGSGGDGLIIVSYIS